MNQDREGFRLGKVFRDRTSNGTFMRGVTVLHDIPEHIDEVILVTEPLAGLTEFELLLRRPCLPADPQLLNGHGGGAIHEFRYDVESVPILRRIMPRHCRLFREHESAAIAAYDRRILGSKLIRHVIKRHDISVRIGSGRGGWSERAD